MIRLPSSRYFVPSYGDYIEYSERHPQLPDTNWHGRFSHERFAGERWLIMLPNSIYYSFFLISTHTLKTIFSCSQSTFFQFTKPAFKLVGSFRLAIQFQVKHSSQLDYSYKTTQWLVANEQKAPRKTLGDIKRKWKKLWKSTSEHTFKGGMRCPSDITVCSFIDKTRNIF